LKWNPHNNYYDDLPLVPPLLLANTLTNHSQPGDSKSEVASALKGGLPIGVTSNQGNTSITLLILPKLLKTETTCSVFAIRPETQKNTKITSLLKDNVQKSIDKVNTGSNGLDTLENFAPQTGIPTGFRSDNLKKDTKEGKIDNSYKNQVDLEL
jgi:hypothetical protein